MVNWIRSVDWGDEPSKVLLIFNIVGNICVCLLVPDRLGIDPAMYQGDGAGAYLQRATSRNTCQVFRGFYSLPAHGDRMGIEWVVASV